jgi:hypothetical protein
LPQGHDEATRLRAGQERDKRCGCGHRFSLPALLQKLLLQKLQKLLLQKLLASRLVWGYNPRARGFSAGRHLYFHPFGAAPLRGGSASAVRVVAGAALCKLNLSLSDIIIVEYDTLKEYPNG